VLQQFTAILPNLIFFYFTYTLGRNRNMQSEKTTDKPRHKRMPRAEMPFNYYSIDTILGPKFVWPDTTFKSRSDKAIKQFSGQKCH